MMGGDGLPNQGKPEGDGIAVEAGVVLGAGPEVGEFKSCTAGDGKSPGDGKDEICPKVVFEITIDRVFCAVPVTNAAAEPEARAEGVNQMPLHGVEWILFPGGAFPEIIIIGVIPERARDLIGPVTALVDDS